MITTIISMIFTFISALLSAILWFATTVVGLVFFIPLGLFATIKLLELAGIAAIIYLLVKSLSRKRGNL